MSDNLRDFLNAALSPGNLIRMPSPEWQNLQNMLAQGQLSAFQGDRGYRTIAQAIMNEEAQRRGIANPHAALHQQGQMQLDVARKLLAARAETYKALGVPEEAGDTDANLRRRQRIDEREEMLKQAKHYEGQAAAYQQHARHLEAQLGDRPPPLPLDPFLLEDLWINEATEETFNEWYQRRK